MKSWKIVVLQAAVLTFGFFLHTSPAYAGGEDYETFQADCNHYDLNTNTYARNSTCTVDLLHGPCIGSGNNYNPRGYNAIVYRLQGRRWVPVTRSTHYDSCAEESENGVNRTMKFRVTKSGTYRVLLDEVGDHQPAFWASVLAVNMSDDASTFFINVRR